MAWTAAAIPTVKTAQLRICNRPLRQQTCQPVSCSVAAAPSTKPEYTRHRLPNGLQLEVIKVPSTQGVSSRPDLVFAHGSFHGAWCWQEHYMPYFANLGYTCYAFSWRGQGGSDWEGEGVDVGTLQVHMEDLNSFISSLPSAPVVVSHSFGGLVVEKYLLSMSDGTSPGYAPLAGAAFLCSVPPSGNKALVGRYMKKDFGLSMRITWGMITKAFARSKDNARELFFSEDLPQADLDRYHKQLAACSPVRLLDLTDMNKQVPLPPAPKNRPPIFVLGADQDNLVDVPAVRELADYYGVEPVIIPNMAHDCMLDTRWEQSAQALSTWLDKVPVHV